MSNAFANEIKSHVSSMQGDMKWLVEKELKSFVSNLEADGIIIIKRDCEGNPSEISFTEEGKAYMEVLCFNLSHRLKKALKTKSSVGGIDGDKQLKSAIESLEKMKKIGFRKL